MSRHIKSKLIRCALWCFAYLVLHKKNRQVNLPVLHKLKLMAGRLPVRPIPWCIALGVGGGLGIGLARLCGLGDLRLQDLLVTFRGDVGGFF